MQARKLPEFTANGKGTFTFPGVVSFLRNFFRQTQPVNGRFNQKGENLPQEVAAWELGAREVMVHVCGCLKPAQAQAPTRRALLVSRSVPPRLFPTSLFRALTQRAASHSISDQSWSARLWPAPHHPDSPGGWPTQASSEQGEAPPYFPVSKPCFFSYSSPALYLLV